VAAFSALCMLGAASHFDALLEPLPGFPPANILGHLCISRCPLDSSARPWLGHATGRGRM